MKPPPVIQLDFDVSAALHGHVLTVEDTHQGFAGIGHCHCGWQGDELWHSMTSPQTVIYPQWTAHVLETLAGSVGGNPL